ncbi:MAG: hypothetical protein GXO89_00090 [Chlorobi bacterium]|nr:hypothetical protein [Chlorobiota bacterium]
MSRKRLGVKMELWSRTSFWVDVGICKEARKLEISFDRPARFNDGRSLTIGCFIQANPERE